MRLLRLLPFLALPLGSCVQGEQSVTLFPDGSGKIVMKVAVKKQVLQMIENMAKEFGGNAPGGPPENPFKTMTDPAQLAANSEGIVGWTTSAPSADGEWIRATVAGYFDDINKVRLYSQKEGPDGRKVRKLSFQARMTKTADGGTISLGNSFAGEFDELNAKMRQERDPETAKAVLELMKPMLQDVQVKVALTLPGAVRSAKGFLQTEGRTVSISLDGDLLIAAATDPEGERGRKLRELAAAGESSATWSGNEVSEDELRRFQDELREAKARGTGSRAGAGPAKASSLGAEADQLTDDEVDRLFIEAQIKIAREQIERGQKDKARATLQGVLKDFPKAKAAQEAKKLLDTLK